LASVATVPTRIGLDHTVPDRWPSPLPRCGCGGREAVTRSRIA
jgi:hypothetical protein